MQELDSGEATLSLGLCTENLARLMGNTRDESDEFALRSQQRAAIAWEQGWFDGDIVSITGPKRNRQRILCRTKQSEQVPTWRVLHL